MSFFEVVFLVRVNIRLKLQILLSFVVYTGMYEIESNIAFLCVANHHFIGSFKVTYCKDFQNEVPKA